MLFLFLVLRVVINYFQIRSIRYVESFEAVRPSQGGSQAMNHPIDAHLLIRHIAIGWPTLKRSLGLLYNAIDNLGQSSLMKRFSSTLFEV